MIRFLNDWYETHPGAIVNMDTTNDSFKRLSLLYRDMGIDNHAFPLALHNPELVGVDPFDPDLSVENVILIAAETKANPWYYFREIAKAPGRSSPEPVKFKAHRGNICLFWLFFNHVTIILEQIRQTGKSFGADTLMTYLMNGGTNNTQINLITKDETLRSNNLARLKEIQELLPYYLNMKRKNDLANTEMLTTRLLGNEYRSHLPNKSPKAALNVGRGLTSPVFHIDEAAFIYNIAITLPAALAAGTAARDLARDAGQPYGTIMTTTSGKKDDRDGKYVYNMIQQSAIWTDKFLDAQNEESLHELIRKNSSQRMGDSRRGILRVYASFNHTQLGYTDEWLYRAIEETGAAGEDADRDFFNRWTSGSQSSPISPEAAEKIRNSESKQYYAEISSPYAYITRWYIHQDQIEHHMRTHKTVMSLDTSDAAGGDDIALTIRDITTGSVLAAGNYNETNLITFSEWIVSWLIKYENLTLIIERRSTGAMIIDYLLVMLVAKNIDPFKRLYNRIVQEADENPDAFKEIAKPMFARDQQIYVKYKKAFGFATSAVGATSRSDLYSVTLNNAIKYTGDAVRDKKIIDQLLGLVIKNGRVDHADGEHDDNCISWLLSFWLMTQGKHLEYYGIDSSKILSQSNYRQTEIQSGDAYEQYYQEQIKDQINVLTDQIKNERDNFIARKLEYQLRTLLNKLESYETTHASIDDFIKHINQERQYRNRMQRYY